MAARGEQGPAPATHVFVAPNPGRRLMLACFVIALLTVCVGGVLAITGRSLVAGIVTGAAAVCAVLLWALLQATHPATGHLARPARRDPA